MRSERTSAIILFILTLVFQVLITSGHIYSFDEEVTFRTALSIVERGATAIEHTESNHFYCKQSPDGNYYSKFGIGFSLFLVPFIILGKVIALATGWSGERYTMLMYFIATQANAVVIAATVAVFYLLTHLTTGRHRLSVVIATALGFATFLMPYGRTLFNDPLVLFNLTAILYMYHRYSNEAKTGFLAVAGICTGFMFATRFEYLVIVPGILSLFALRIYKTNLPLKRIVALLVPVIIVAALLGLYNFSRFGSFHDTGIFDQDPSDRFSTPILTGLFGMFCSPGKGIFFYAPVLLLSLAGLKTFIRKRGGEGWILLLLILAPIIIVHGLWHSWMGGWSWGPRRLIGVLALTLLPAIDYLAVVSGKRLMFARRIFIFLFGLGLLVQISGIMVNFMSYIAWAQGQGQTAIYSFAWAPYIGHIRYALSGDGAAGLDLFWLSNFL